MESLDTFNVNGGARFSLIYLSAKSAWWTVIQMLVSYGRSGKNDLILGLLFLLVFFSSYADDVLFG